MLEYVFVLFAVSVFFFFKQKTAYEMRISDWSSDVCSSDLKRQILQRNLASEVNVLAGLLHRLARQSWLTRDFTFGALRLALIEVEIGRASCRARVCQYV